MEHIMRKSLLVAAAGAGLLFLAGEALAPKMAYANSACQLSNAHCYTSVLDPFCIEGGGCYPGGTYDWPGTQYDS